MKTDKSVYTPPSFLPESRLRLVRVPFQHGERMEAHPDLAPLLREGWQVKSVAPRVIEGEGLTFLVVLQRPRLRRPAPRAVSGEAA